jgi:hypothetical protein
MSQLRRSAAWLSDEMAGALAATCPCLQATDVVRAADELATAMHPAHVTSNLLQLGPDLLSVRRIVEALRALRDLAA